MTSCSHSQSEELVHHLSVCVAMLWHVQVYGQENLHLLVPAIATDFSMQAAADKCCAILHLPFFTRLRSSSSCFLHVKAHIDTE